jgi:hypothetical protein
LDTLQKPRVRSQSGNYHRYKEVRQFPNFTLRIAGCDTWG